LKANNSLQQILQSIEKSFPQMEETLPNYFLDIKYDWVYHLAVSAVD
jgi:hypothetical protein